MKLQPSVGTSNHIIWLALISLCDRHLTLIRESITIGPRRANSPQCCPAIPRNVSKSKSKFSARRILDRDLVKKKLSECVIKYTDDSFRQAAIGWG